MKISCPDYWGKEHLVGEADIIDRTSVYGVYINGGKVLLVQDVRRDFWELPGGGVEEGEDMFEALKREVQEETGLETSGVITPLVDFEEYYFDNYEKRGWRAHRHFFLIDAVDGRVLANGNGDDTKAAAFIDTNTLHGLSIKPNIQKVLKLALHNYPQPPPLSVSQFEQR